MAIKFSNNAATTLSAGISAGVTSFQVASASGFPTLGGSDWTYVTLGTTEVVKVTAISGTTFTCIATSEAHSNGDNVELRMTAELLNDFAEDTEALPLAGGTMTGNTAHGTNVKSTYGASADLEIYHNGTDSIIDDNGAGKLVLKGSTAVELRSRSGLDMGVFIEGGASKLYHSGNVKLATTSTGIDISGTNGDIINITTTSGTEAAIWVDGNELSIKVDADNDDVNSIITFDVDAAERLRVKSTGIDVTGTVTADSLTVEGSNGNFAIGSDGATVTMTRGAANYLYASHSSGELYLGAGGVASFLKVDNTGDISFYEDTGSTPKFIWDASAESLSIGTASTTALLNLKKDGGGSPVRIDIHNQGTATGDDAHISFETQAQVDYSIGIDRSSSNFVIARSQTLDSNQRIVIDTSGNVGIGVASPTSGGAASSPKLHVNGAVRIDGNIAIAPDSGTPYISGGTVGTQWRNNANSSTLLTILNGGNVGIGTTSPSAPLDVVVSSNLWVGEFTQSNTSNGDGLLVSVGSTAAADYALSIRSNAGNTHVLAAKADGNVGIGESAPANLLHVKASDTGIAPHGSAQIVLEREGTNYLQFLTAETGTSGLLFGDGSDVDVGKIVYDHNIPSMQFHVETGLAMTIDSSQNVGINTSSPASGYMLDVQGKLSLGATGGADNTYIDQKEDGNLILINSGRAADTGYIAINRYNTASGGTTYYRDFKVYDGKNGQILTVDGSSGNVGIGTSSVNQPLHVKMDTSSTIGSSGSGIQIENDGGGDIGIHYSLTGATDWYTYVDNSASDVFKIRRSTSDFLTIDSSGNVGIGTDSPSELFEVHSATSNADFLLKAAAASQDARQFIRRKDNNGRAYLAFQDTDNSYNWYTGLLRSSGNKYAIGTADDFSNAGTKLVIDSSGKVGIGETTPLGKLHIKEQDSGGTVNANFDQLVLEDDSHSGMTILSGTSGDGGIYFGDSSANNMGQFKYKHATNAFEFTTNNGSPTMTLDSAGKVGIGTTSPAYKTQIVDSGNCILSVVSGGSNEASLYLGDSVAGRGRIKYNNSDDSLAIYTDNSERLHIDSSGNVGIGTGSPASNLHIYNRNSEATLRLQRREDDGILNTDDIIGSLLFESNDDTTNSSGIRARIDAVIQSTAGQTYIKFTTANSGDAEATTEKMRIIADGNVGIGTQSPSQKLHVEGDVVIDKTHNGYSGTRIHDDSGGDYNSYIDLGRNQSGTRLSIRNGGRVQGTSPWSNATGNTIVSFANGGIAFGSDTATANTLDDYEEGNWSPVLTGSNNTSHNTGRYTKIGTQVMIQGEFRCTSYSNSGSTQVTITGMPYPIRSLSNYNITGTIYIVNGFNQSNDYGFTLHAGTGASVINIVGQNQNTGYNYSYLQRSQMTSGTVEVFIAMHYQTN